MNLFDNGIRRRFALFLAASMTCHFMIMIDVTITVPVINSIFLTYFSSDYYPYVWGCAMPLNFTMIFLYNHLLRKYGCLRLFISTYLVTACLHACLVLWVRSEHRLAFVAYMWKDVYVLLLFHQLWAVIHATIKEHKAHYLYGMFFGLGSIGGVIGGLIVRRLAMPIGSEGLLLMSIALEGGILSVYFLVLHCSGSGKKILPALGGEGKCGLAGFTLIAKSHYLKMILLSVIFMQLSATIMDYIFNKFLETTFPDQDLRTQFCGKLWSYVEIAAFLLQICSGFLFVRLLGEARSQLVLPYILTLLSATYLIYPGFTLVSSVFGAIKAMDYSLFQVIKENTYVRLTTNEKFRARSVIDVFVARLAKGGAAALVALLGTFPGYFLNGTVFLLGLIWLGLTYGFLSRLTRRV